MKNQNSRGVLLVVASAVMWAFAGVAAQLLFDRHDVDIDWLVAAREVLAGVILTAITIVYRRKKCLDIFKEKINWFRIPFFALSILVMQYTYNVAIAVSNAGTATMLQYFNPVMILVYDAFLFREFPRVGKWIAVVLSILGIFAIVSHGKLENISMSFEILAWGLGSALAMAVYTVFPRKMLLKYKTIDFLGYSMLLGGIVYVACLGKEMVSPEMNLEVALYVGYIVIFGTVLPFIMYMNGIAMIGGMKASVIATLEPVMSAIIVFALGTPFVPFDIVGMVLIVLAVVIISYEKQ